jgi:small nuclear ribonucleoprotein (snRNP)-like protein
MKSILIIILFVLAAYNSLLAQTVNVVLKNSKVVVGDLVEENPQYILVANDLGQIRVPRENIESITFNPYVKMKTTYKETNINGKNDSVPDGYKFVLNDRVVVHLNNGNVVSGLLLAKSIDMIMIQTDVGSLTIPKKDLQMLEYVSNEYSERGEVVIVHLNNGTNLEGNIYFEDSDNLSLDTQLGRLTLDKKNLRSIEYTGKYGLGETSLVDQYSNIQIGRTRVEPRLDVFSIGVSPGFGDDFKPGYAFTYEDRYLLDEFKGFYLSGLGRFGATYFPLNQDIFQNDPFGVSAKGGALLTTIGGGISISVYPQESSFFDFSIAPILEGHLIYTTLELNYPSFPSQNSKVTETTFKFGAGTKIALDFIFDGWKLGASYDLHFIFGAEDYNVLSLNFIKKVF